MTKKLTLFVELNEKEKKDFLAVKKKFGTRTNTETVRMMIRQLAGDKYD